MSTRILQGDLGDPPRTRRHDYLLVVLQLFWRMRLDLLLFGLIAAFVLLNGVRAEGLTLNTMGFSVMGIAVSIFIAFRNTQAITRWWEARSLWGAMVNHSRKWRDALIALLDPQHLSTPQGRGLVEFQVALVWLLNFELRNFWRADLRQGVDGLLADLDLPPDTSLQQLCRERARAIQQLHAQGWIDGWGRQQLVEIALQCLDSLGGLQRIRNTPIPASYDVFVRLITWLYGLQLLLAFQRSGTSGIGLALFFGFLTAERIGSYVEGPFDRDGSSFSLPLNTICSTITADLMERPLAFGAFAPSSDPTRWH